MTFQGKKHSLETRKKMSEIKGKEKFLAASLGEKFYFTNVPCKNNHISERYVSTGMCVICQKNKAKQWQKKNKEKISAKVMIRHAKKLQRTPKWLSVEDILEIKSIYAYCGALRKIGLDYQVDHIVPLRGKIVSGLHVPWNLQIIKTEENIKKSNIYYCQ